VVSCSSSEPASKRRKASSSGIIVTPESASSKVIKTVDPLLRLAFSFYDENQVGHVLDEHLQDICTSLGLGLTRHEVEKMVYKLTSKGCLNYRKWTDKTEAEIESEAKANEDESLLAEKDRKRARRNSWLNCCKETRIYFLSSPTPPQS